MTEDEALRVAAVRAVETTDESRTRWTDADRSWASRAAATVVGEGALPEVFIARRAGVALERLRALHPSLGKAIAGLTWRQWVGVAIVALAFFAGLAVDRIGAGRHANLLAPPVLVLLAWNLSVYAWLAASAAIRPFRAVAPDGGVLRSAVIHAATHATRWLRAASGDSTGGAIASLARDWTQIAGRLYLARAARILHLAAALFAGGVIAGMYLRGLAVAYSAGWESTFLGQPTVSALLGFVLGPASRLSGIAVPAVESGVAGSAAPWIHLWAITVALFVILPRLVLALLAWTIERARAMRIPVVRDEPYFQRVLRGFHGGAARVSVVPYSYHAGAESLEGLQAVLSRTFGSNVSVLCAPPVAYGDEDALPATARPDAAAPVVALFSLAATPEREAHVAFVEALGRPAGSGPVIVLVDEAPFRARNGDTRLEQRRQAWRDVFGERGIEPVFADLASPALADVESGIEARLSAATHQ